MREEVSKWLKDFNKLVEAKAFDEAVMHLTNNYEIGFETPSFRSIYNIASNIPNHYYKSPLSKILFAWVCFVCGDNKGVNWVLTSINESELETSEDKSHFYALKSMIVFYESKEKTLNYAKASIDILPKDSNNFTQGNAYLTYARQLTNSKSYREGAVYFGKAYEVFQRIGNTFLSITSFVNECLNLYSLGQCKEVIVKCQRVLMLNSTHNSEIEDYINIIKLPMGMCYYEMNKISMAIKALNQARISIDNLELVHMHGLVELYQFQCYRIMNDKEKMNKTIEGLESIFKNLHYPQIKYLIIYMKLRIMLDLKDDPKDEWIEELELAYQLNPELTPIFVLEVLAELKFKGYSELITEDILIKRLEKLRFEGHITQIQSISLYLSEFFYRNKDIDTMKIHLKTACDIYNEYGLFVQFIDRDFECFKYLNKVNSSVVKILERNGIYLKEDKEPKKKSEYNLTNRELEVLKLICNGKSNKEIAESLFISIGTTKWHISNIFSKLGVKKRIKAVEKARKLNLINP